ncbi:uncharacterized protein LOC125646228 [Ostrea edulis]|uniref:uncharacterized protein LOC125646228 n=1 Tax=Ostrea edulis TaxID=37623 RepID=UPI002095FE17|nr:uncharacterized protein LOC125646228 [Ostrea edulis]
MKTKGVAINFFIKKINLKPLKNIKFSFDPYHGGVRSIREMMCIVNSPKLIDTNPNITTKIDIKSDRSPPEMQLKFADGHSVIFKTEHLSTMTISEKFAKLCQDRVESVSVGESAIFASSKPGKIGKKK